MNQRKDVRENNPSFHEKYLKPFLILYMVADTLELHLPGISNIGLSSWAVHFASTYPLSFYTSFPLYYLLYIRFYLHEKTMYYIYSKHLLNIITHPNICSFMLKSIHRTKVFIMRHIQIKKGTSFYRFLHSY